MAVQLIIGRAGTGKTVHCLREIRRQMADDPLGPPLLLITPEQATFTTERLLLTGNWADGAPTESRRQIGTFRAQVLSFRRLAMLMARDMPAEEGGAGAAGRGIPKPMDDMARVVLLEETVRRRRVDLNAFAAVADRPGFIARLDATLRELRQHGHTGATLRALMPPEDHAEPAADPSITWKLHDLALLLDDWSGEMDKRATWDFEHFLHQAALNAGRSPLIVPQRAGASAAAAPEGRARVWVDAFSAMTALEIRMLVALAQHAQEVVITLLADPDSPAMEQMRDIRRPENQATAKLADGDDGGDGADAFGLFSRTERLHRRLIDAFRRHQIQMRPALHLRNPWRFDHPALQKVEAELFSDGPGKSATTQSAAAAPVATAAIAPPSPDKTAAPRPAQRLRKPLNAPPQKSLFDLADDMPSLALESPPAAAPRIPSPAIPATVVRSDIAAVPGNAAPAVELWEASNPETEVRIAAQAIRAMVIPGTAESAARPGGPLRYRDIGIIVPNLEAYQDALRRVFTEHQIPHFIDQRRTLAHHPLIELLRSAVAVAQNHWDRDDLLLLLKSQLAGVAEEDVSLLENYLLEHGISHNDFSRPFTWIAPNQEDDEAYSEQIPDYLRQRLRRVNATREKLRDALHEFVQEMLAAGPAPAADVETGAAVVVPATDAAQYPRALRRLISRLGVPAQLDAWAAAATPELAQTHRQAGREIERLLALLETIFSGRQRTLAEFSQLFEGALENLSLGLIPATVDQVLVSSVMRSRVPELEVAIVLGAVEGEFPKVVPEDPILSDAQRADFNSRTADPIGAGSDRQLLDMPFFDYVALTRARRRLIVCHPRADRHGKALRESRYLPRLRDLLGGELVERHFAAEHCTAIERIATTDDLLAAVAGWARQVIQTDHDADPLKSSQAALYNHLIGSSDPALQAARRHIWPAIAGIPLPHLAAEFAERFYPPARPLRMSVTQLEKFAACPLQYFMHYTLGLRPRKQMQLDQLDMGILYHRILERVYGKILEGTLAWPECSEESLRALLEEQVDAATVELHAELAHHTPGYEKLRARLKWTLGILLEADRRRACQGTLRPVAVELVFGRSNLPSAGCPAAPGPRAKKPAAPISLPLLPITTAGQRTLMVNGKIDRMDAAGDRAAVIDYKSSATRRLDLYRVFHGISLQLPVYALVTRTLAKKQPIAALYHTLGLTRRTVKTFAESAAPDSDSFYQRFKPRGVADVAGVDSLDRALRPEITGDTGRGRSDWFPFSFNKTDHAPAKNSDLFSHENMQLILEFTRWKIAALADELAGGRIAPQPYRSKNEAPCDYCDFASLCPFDRVNGHYRSVPPMKPYDALDAMRQAIGE